MISIISAIYAGIGNMDGAVFMASGADSLMALVICDRVKLMKKKEEQEHWLLYMVRNFPR